MINKKSLLILDNVDGASWVHDEALANFQKHFIEAILEYSHSNLKILITSQQEIKPVSEFRSLQLLPPSPESCVSMFTLFVNEASNEIYTIADHTCVTDSPFCIAKSQVETLCSQVGRIPKAVQVLASTLTSTITIGSVIERLEEKFNALKVLNESDYTLLSAFELAFEFLQPEEYQVCCLLLTKFPGFVSVATTEPVITPDLMARYSESFHVRRCLDKLSRKAFIETTSYKTVKINFHFHTLTRDFLMNTRKVAVPRDVLETFWATFFEKAGDVKEYAWLRDDLGEEDTEIIEEFLSDGRYDSYRLAQHLTYNYDIKNLWRFGQISKSKKRLLDKAVSTLLTDCKQPGMTYPAAEIFITLNSYHNIFAHILPDDDEGFMEKLFACETKAEQLNSLKNGSDYMAMFKGFDFYHTVSSKCESIQNSHELCNKRWKYNLKHFIRKLILVVHALVDHCNRRVRTPDCIRNIARSVDAGMISYSEGNDENAIEYLQLALKDNSSSCKDIHDMIVNIALYSIFTKRNELENSEETLRRIDRINFQDTSTNLACHRGVYMDIVIPFLNSTNKTDLAGEMWGRYVHDKSTAVSDGSLKMSLPDVSEVKPSNAYAAGVKTGQVVALKTPGSSPDESNQLTPEIAKKILEGKASLFCFVFKDMIDECHS